MTHADFEREAIDLVANYWRISAAMALYRDATIEYSGALQYDNVPFVGAVAGILTSETVESALASVAAYIRSRLPRDLFLALISKFEARLVARLSALGLNTAGTFGALQRRIEGALAIPNVNIEDIDEIRIRRNCITHHNDCADADYVAAASVVSPRAPAVLVPAVGDNIVPSSLYLSYVADALIRYSTVV